MIEIILIFINISLLILHEMDAIHCQEWKMFPFLRKLSDKVGYLVFLIAHLPLFFVILFLFEYQFEILFWILNIFLIFHWLLHTILKNHQANSFKSQYSIVLISLMGLVGLIAIMIKVVTS